MILDIDLKEGLALSFLLAYNLYDLPMGRLFNECHYIFCHDLSVAFSCTDTCCVCDCQYSFKALLYSFVNDSSDKCSFKCKSVETAFPTFNFWRYCLSVEVIASKMPSISGRLAQQISLFFAYSDVTSKVEWLSKHVATICAAQRLFGRWLLFICVMTQWMDFQIIISTVVFTTLTALGFFSLHRERDVEINYLSLWITYIPHNDTSRLQTSRVLIMSLLLEKWGHLTKQSNI